MKQYLKEYFKQYPILSIGMIGLCITFFYLLFFAPKLNVENKAWEKQSYIDSTIVSDLDRLTKVVEQMSKELKRNTHDNRFWKPRTLVRGGKNLCSKEQVKFSDLFVSNI